MARRIVFISDTHQLDVPNLPEADLLVHSGDWCGPGPVHSLKSNGREQLAHFGGQVKRWKERFPSVIVIAGNHDFIAEAEPELTRKTIVENGAIYLNDSGAEWNGLSFWGSPIQPWFHDWAFNRMRGEEIRRHWDLIPQHTDVLITHGPPHGILDQVYTGEKPHVGCEELLQAVYRVKPKIHVFGHIHESYGETEREGVRFINASSLNEHYEIQNPPIVVELSGSGSLKEF